jgi:hypothetical protein
MIVEIRTYKVKSGTRPEFVDILKTKIIPELKRLGGKCAGPWVSADDDITICWFRGFADVEARITITNQFYGGAFWEEISHDVMSKLEKYESIPVAMDESAVKWV